jgi:Tol biopolymer transport system component/pimeloyl-ACP methyl ester carboxylesterase
MKPRSIPLWSLIALILVLALLVGTDVSPAAAQGSATTTRVSVSSSGAQGDGPSQYTSISADGRYVAFSSHATNLVTEPRIHYWSNIFVHDRVTATTQLITVATDGQPANNSSYSPVISADGRYVVYSSLATNLVSDDTNGQLDVFLYDRDTRITERVTGPDGAAAELPSISADGRYIAFSSNFHLFVLDRETRTISLVARRYDGLAAGGAYPSISADGRYVAFESNDAIEEPEPDDSWWLANHIYVHDRVTGQSTRISRVPGDYMAGWSRRPSISANGRIVAFQSVFDDLIPGDSNGYEDVVVHDLDSGVTTLVSVASDGTQGNGRSTNPVVSSDGRFVAFDSLASNLVPGDTNRQPDVFVHDRQSSVTSRVSVATNGAQGNGGSGWHFISSDGRFVTFASSANNLVPGDTNETFDIFVRDRHGEYPPPERPLVILIPGVLASKLSNFPADDPSCAGRPRGEVWPNLSGLRNDISYNISLNTLRLRDDGITPHHPCDVILPSGFIGGISIPWLNIPYKDYYNRFINEIIGEGYRVSVFSYDWRLDIDANSRNLHTYINGMGPQKVILVGHSMGGLLARHYTRNAIGARRVEKVITVGTPYWGAPELAKHMRAGTTPVPFDPVLINSITWQVMRNSTGAMQLLPSEAYFRQVGAYYMNNGHFLRTHEDTRAFFIARRQNEVLLDRGRDFHRRIDDFRSNLHVPYYVLTANHLSTPAIVDEYPCGLSTCWRTYQLVGDGTVPWGSARLSGRAGDWSGNAQVCTFTQASRVMKEHGELLSDPVVLGDVKRILRGDSPTACLSATAIAQAGLRPEPAIQLSIAGEARVAVQDAEGNITRMTDEGVVVNGIPGSSYEVAGTTTIITLPASTIYTLSVEATSETPLQIDVTELQAASFEDLYEPEQVASFAVPVTEGTSVTLQVEPEADFSTLQLEVDSTQDQTLNLVLPPSSISRP